MAYEIALSTYAGPMRGVFSRYIGPGPREPEGAMNPPESQEEAHESLKGPLAVDILLWFFGGDFQLKSSVLREVSACLWGPKAVLFHLAEFFLEALHMW